MLLSFLDEEGFVLSTCSKTDWRLRCSFTLGVLSLPATRLSMTLKKSSAVFSLIRFELLSVPMPTPVFAKAS